LIVIAVILGLMMLVYVLTTSLAVGESGIEIGPIETTK
jgi:hypothetical protein